jgi:hypothetical protein
VVDKRLEDLQAELDAFVKQANIEISQFIQQWEMRIAEQRGRIAEREYTLAENALQSHTEGSNSNGRGELVEALRDAARNGA